MAAEKVVLEFEANLAGMQEALASIPGMTEKEAKEAVKALRKNFLAAEKAAKKAAKVQGKAFGKAAEEIDESAEATKKLKEESGEAASVLGKLKSGVSLLAPELEGAFDAAQKLADGTEGLAQAGVSTTAIMGAAGLTAALGVAAAAYKILDERTQAASAALEMSRQTTLQLTDAYRQLAVIQGKEVADNASADLINSLQAQRAEYMGLIEDNKTLIEKYDELIFAAPFLIDSWRWATGADIELQQLNASLDQTNSFLEITKEQTRKINEEIESLGAQEDLAALLGIPDAGAVAEDPKIAKEREAKARKAAEAARKRREEERKALEAFHREIDRMVDEFHKKETDRLKAQAKARESLAQIATTAARSQMEPEQQLTAAYGDQLVKIGELAEAHPRNLEVQQQAAAARLAIEKEYFAELGALRDADAAKEQAAIEARRNDSAALAKSLIQTGDMLTQARLENIDTTTEAGKTEASRMFATQKGLAIVTALIDGALATSKAFAQFGPPPSPAGIAAAAAAAAQTSAAVALIAAQKPEFPMGGIVPSMDHRLISAQPGEAVLNRQAVDRLGPSGVDALNNGRGGVGEVVVINRYEHRVFSAFVADHLAQGGPLSNALNRRSGPPGHSRRRR